MFNTLLNTFAPSLDTLAALLKKEYGEGESLPIGRYVEEHDAGQRRRHVRRQRRTGEPNNFRSHISRWFSAAGRLLQQLPTLRRHIDEPSVVMVRNVSLVWPGGASNPRLVTHTLPSRVAPVRVPTPRDLRRAHSYAGSTRSGDPVSTSSKQHTLLFFFFF